MCWPCCALSCRWRVLCRCRMVVVMLSRWYPMSTCWQHATNFSCWTHADILPRQNAMWNAKPAFACAIIPRCPRPYHSTLTKCSIYERLGRFSKVLALWLDAPKKMRLYHQTTPQSLQCITLTIITHVSTPNNPHAKPIAFCPVSVPYSSNKKTSSSCYVLEEVYCRLY